MFWLKKFISAFMMPLQFALVAGLIGLVLFRTRRWRRAGQTLLALGAAVLLLASNKWLSGRLVAPLESSFPPIGEFQPGDALPPQLGACRYIVVLGSGNDGGDARPALTRLSTSGRARLAEALRIMRLLPEATLIVSGTSDPVHGGVPHARVLADAAASLGVDRARIRMIDDARDTEEEAARLRDMVGDTPFALVTSAWHMPRAAALCAAQHLRDLPCPTDYIYCAPPNRTWSDFTWDTESLDRSTMAVHEYLGILWSELRGRA